MANNSRAEPKNFALRNARRRLAGELIPREVHLEVTYRCNLQCLHCYLEPYIRKPQPDELSTSEMQRVLKQIFEIGVYLVNLSGGEALCRPDIFEIMNYAKEQGLFFALKTNGTLITESVADKLKELGTFHVDVSLYGATSATHDNVTGVAGSFVGAVHAINLLRERNIPVSIKTVLMNCNAEECQEIGRIAKEMGVSYFPDPMLFPKIGQPGSTNRLRVDDEQLRTIVRQRNWAPDDANLLTNNLKRHLICGAGRTRCDVSPQGEVFPCTVWRIPLGNLRQQSFKDIWYGEAASRLRAIEISELTACTECELVNYCARCQGLVHMENGDISGPSSESCRLARAIKGVRDEREENLCEPLHRIRAD